jgi:DNA-binding GntR family transcriptional regulator
LLLGILAILNLADRIDFLQELYSKLREFSSRLSALIHKSLLGDEWDEHADTLRRDHEKIISALSAKDCALIGDISDQDVALFKKKILQALERRIPDCAKFDAPKRGDISS